MLRLLSTNIMIPSWLSRYTETQSTIRLPPVHSPDSPDKISSPVLISPWWEVINIGRSILTFCSLSWAVRRGSPHSSKIYPRKVFWKRFCGWISRKNPIANYSPRIKKAWEDLGAVRTSMPRSRGISAWNRQSRSREDTQTSWGATIGFVTSPPRRNTKVYQPLSTTGTSALQFWHHSLYYDIHSSWSRLSTRN